MFGSETYIKRRQLLKSKLSKGIILFLGNDESPVNYPDNTYHFRQDSTFLYYFGIDRPSLCAVIDVESGKETLFGEELTIENILWTGYVPTLADECAKAGIASVMPVSKLHTILRRARDSGRSIHFLPPYRAENKLTLLKLLDIHPDHSTQKSSLEFIRAVVSQREIKDDYEIAEIEKAVNCSSDMHEHAIRIARPGMLEAEIAAAVTRTALQTQGHPAFPVIATTRGAVLHNHYHGNLLKEGDLFLLDAGAESSLHYAGDLTSTFPVSKKFSRIQRDVYQIVLDAHNGAAAMLKPGIAFRDIHLEAGRIIFEGLKSLGLARGDTAEAVARGAHALFFPHGLGHMMGLDVHDMEDLGEINVGYDGESKSTQFGLRSLRLAKKLKTGFVLTIEPGVYFIPELIGLWKSEGRFEPFINYPEVEKLIGFGGVRIEHDYLVTDNSSRLFGPKKPMPTNEVENLRSA